MSQLSPRIATYIAADVPGDSTPNPGDMRLGQMACFWPMQFHRESIPISTPIPNAIGRGFCTNLRTERLLDCTTYRRRKHAVT